MSNWKEYKLAELVEITSSKRIMRSEYQENGIPFFRSKEIIELNSGNEITTELFISKERFLEIKNKFGTPSYGDILLTSVGTLGLPYFVNYKEEFYFKDGNLTWFRKFNNILRSKYLYYWFASPVGRKALKEITIGSTQPALTITGLKSLTIHLPTLEEQDYIIEILDHLSCKIQLNTQINQTLEQIAQALFKSWFVDFDPVRAKVQALSDGLSLEQAELAAMQAISGKTPEELTALSQTQPDRYAELAETAKAFPCEMVEVDGVEVPKRWEVKPLGDLISFVKGKKPKAVSPNQEENMLPHILTSSLEGKYNEFCESNKLVTVEYHNTIMLMDGSNSGRVAIGHNSVIGSTLAKINLENNKLWAIIYQFLKHKETDIQANTTGTTIPHTDKNRVNNYLMTIPNDFLLDKFTELFDNSLLKIISNRNQIISLETIRDLLLPRLLNGEIE